MAKAPAPSFLEKRYPFVFFSFFYFLFTALTYKDFGETWDESGVYTRGMVLGRYLMDGEWMGLVHKAAPDDGMVLYDHWYAWVLSLLNPAAGIDTYHWLNLVFGYLLFAAAYEVALAQLQKPWAALLAPLFLFLTPRLIGDLPANPKDGPFAVLYFISLAAVFLIGRKPFPILGKILILGALFGLTLSQRLAGFTLFLVWPLYEWIQWRWPAANIKKPKVGAKPFWSEMIPAFLLVFLAANFILVATWPYLGADYFHRLAELLGAAQSYPWSSPVLFMGREVPAPDLPRIYLPLFLLLTTPLFLLGWGAASFRALKKIKSQPLWSLLALGLGVNLGLELLLKPVIYDGLRHFLYLLPLVGVIAALAFADFLAVPRLSKTRWALVAVTALAASLPALDMARLHPYEYVYFNELAGGLKGAQKNFETDYWGASYKESVEWVAGLTPGNANQPVTLASNGNAYQLAPYCPSNFHWTDDLAQADYYLSTTRGGQAQKVDPSKIVHVVEREGVPLCYVFKLK